MSRLLLTALAKCKVLMNVSSLKSHQSFPFWASFESFHFPIVTSLRFGCVIRLGVLGPRLKPTNTLQTEYEG